MRAMFSGFVCASIVAVSAAASASPFQLTSTDFKADGAIADKQVYGGFGCSGQNVSPALEWKGAPAGTKSFALLVHDPDAPTGSGWWHWVVYNLPPTTTSLAAGAGKADGSALPKGATQGNTDFGSPGYGGPCPPPGSGKHHYHFTLYALDVARLEVPAGATAAMVSFSANAHALAKAKLTGLYGRDK